MRGLLAFPLVLAVSACATEEVEVYTGLRGEARRNPLLAAERTLERLGIDTVSEPEAIPGTPAFETATRQRDRVLVTSGRSYEVEGPFLDALEDWLAAGGEAVVCLDGFERPDDDEGFPLRFDANGNELWRRPHNALLERFEVTREFFDGMPGEACVVDERDVWLPEGSGWLAEPGGDPVPWLDLEVGEGRIRLLPSGAPFSNLELADLEHALLLYEWVEPEGAVLLSLAREPGLWGLLVERAPEALWAALALLLIWLWSASARFGPTERLAEAAVHGFTRHVAASGRFLWRQDRGPMLLDALRRRTLRQAERRIPAVSRERRRELVASVAAHTGRPEDDVHDLLFSAEALRPRDLTRLVRDLVRLHRDL